MPIIELSDASDARLAVFSSMTDAQLRDRKQLVGLARSIDASASPERFARGLFIAESRNVIERAIAAGCQPFALLTERRWESDAEELLATASDASSDLPLFVGSHSLVASITGYEGTRGPIAAFLRPPEQAPEALLAHARRVAVLEDITNYTNIGAIFRSAAAIGIDAVLLTSRCHDPLYRRAARVSMGTVFQVPWARLGGTWPEDGLRLLRDRGFTTVALALADDALPLHSAQLKRLDRIALVLGTEGDGLSDATIAACDIVAKIPMDHGVDSLNVAAASAVAFWELRINHRDETDDLPGL